MVILRCGVAQCGAVFFAGILIALLTVISKSGTILSGGAYL